MTRSRWSVGLAAASVVVALGAAACGGSSGSGGGSTKITGTGPFTFVTGKDTSGTLQGQINVWNKAHPKEKATLIELPEDADSQRQQMVTNLSAKSSRYDILNVDVVWTPEFAKHGWIVPLDKSQFQLDQFLKGPVQSATFEGKLYAAPYVTDGGLLYYRKDLLQQAGISNPPATWSEMLSDCKKVQVKNSRIGCYAGQFFKYEGLTVNFSEAVNSAGGKVLDANGKPALDAKAVQGLQFLTNGFKQGYIPKDAITYKEEESRRAFQTGKLVFLRNWPYVYALANASDSQVKGKFAVAPLPGLNGPGISSLGGHNLALSAYSKHKASALAFIKYFTSHAFERANLQKNSLAPVWADLYDDPALQKQFPYLPVLKKSVDTAIPRPQTPYYQQVTQAIENDAYAALQGSKSPQSAIDDLKKQLSSIGSGG
jgi:multiple sugar transport system substrate-binding protein